MHKPHLQGLMLVFLAMASSFILARAEAGSTLSYTVDVKIDDNIYTFMISLRTPTVLTTEQAISVEGSIKLIYSSKPNASVYAILDMRIGNVTLYSTPLGTCSIDCSRNFSAHIQLPPGLARAMEEGYQEATLTIELRAYSGSSRGTGEVNVPLMIYKPKPLLSLNAYFSSTAGRTLTLVQGEKPFVEATVIVANSGETPLNGIELDAQLNGATVATEPVTGALNPGSARTLKIHIPVPYRPGAYQVVVRASASHPGGVIYGETRLELVVLPQVKVYLEPLNTTASTIEGAKLCYRVSVTPPPPPNSTLVIQARLGGGAWSTVYAVGFNDKSTVSCIAAPHHDQDKPLELYVRAVVDTEIYGSHVSYASTPVSVLVYPLKSILSKTSLQLVASKTKAYRPDKIVFHVTLNPTIPACIPVTLLVLHDNMWEPLRTGKACNGEAAFTLYAAELAGSGAGNTVFLKAASSIGTYRLQSNMIMVKILEKPRVNIAINPTIIPPEGTVTLTATVQPAIQDYTVNITTSWGKGEISIHSSDEKTTIPLKGPSTPGTYSVNAVLRVDGYVYRKTLTLIVQNATITVALSPSQAKPAETVKALIETIPPLTAQAILKIMSGNTTVAQKQLEIIGGKATTELQAPKEAGDYTIEVLLPKYQARGEARLKVAEKTANNYQLLLAIIPQKTGPGSNITATITIQPKPEKNVDVTLLVENTPGQWSVAAAGRYTGKPLTLTFQAPSKPGRYRVKATAPSLKAESQPLLIEVVEEKKMLQLDKNTLYTAIIASAALAVAWSIRSLRKR